MLRLARLAATAAAPARWHPACPAPLHLRAPVATAFASLQRTFSTDAPAATAAAPAGAAAELEEYDESDEFGGDDFLGHPAPSLLEMNVPAHVTAVLPPFVVRHINIAKDAEELAELTRDQNTNDMFAVVQVGGHQYRVLKGDRIAVQKIDQPVGTKIALEKVLLLGSKAGSVIGRPIIENAKVMASIEELLQDDKVLIFKKRRRKNSQRLRGHRQWYTVLKIDGIDFDMKAALEADPPSPPDFAASPENPVLEEARRAVRDMRKNPEHVKKVIARQQAEKEAAAAAIKERRDAKAAATKAAKAAAEAATPAAAAAPRAQ